ncbi:calcium-binding protein [Caulobacter sp. BP25]|uniref:calcium-binding protein n=1 Tax=Caulobacter sp. BP25 TaxID=2048900 RepID=UPI000C13D94E|nr:calcium-binding protein [Caulobacter sp. BP25]PHY20219.1 hypothetical protein CSW59_08535 [Caulobacter sp. BP25]
MATITGAAADDILIGTAAADVIYGLAGDDTLLGYAGDDTLVGGAGADALFGGDGVDVASYASASVGVTINLATGAHTGDAAGDTFDGIEIIQGSNLNDLFVANAAANRLDGSGGWTDTISYEASSSAVNVNLTTNAVSGGDAQGDTISSFEKVIGSAYGDVLASSSPGHILQGGAGDDLYLVSGPVISIIEAADEGEDSVVADVSSFRLAANVETLMYVGTSTFTGYGNALANIIIGGVLGDSLFGLEGDDTLLGGDGNDTLNGGSGSDNLVGAGGDDTLYFYGDGQGRGGEGGDLYYIASLYSVSIWEADDAATDVVRFASFWSVSDIRVAWDGDDLLIASITDTDFNSAVRLVDYGDDRYIETFEFADGTAFDPLGLV